MHNLSSLIQYAMEQPTVTPFRELMLAYWWQKKQRTAALKELQTAYLRYAITTALRYKGYQLPIEDLVSAGCVGLAQAADRFDPHRGVRFSTLARWWIRAAIQDYVMRNVSTVRIGSTAQQKTLFFSVRRVRGEVERQMLARGEQLDQYQIRAAIADTFNLKVQQVEQIEAVFASARLSLNDPVYTAGESGEWVGHLADEAMIEPGQQRDTAYLRSVLVHALGTLPERERHIVVERLLLAESRTLQSLGDELGISKERVRQLEAAALRKLRRKLNRNAPEVQLLLKQT